MLSGLRAPRDRQLSDLRLWQKDRGTGIALKETAHTFDPLIRVLPALRFRSTMGELRRVGKQSSIHSRSSEPGRVLFLITARGKSQRLQNHPTSF